VVLDLPQQEGSVFLCGEQAGDDHHRAVLIRNAALEPQPGQRARRHNRNDQPVDKVDCHRRRRQYGEYPCEQNEETCPTGSDSV
jgi:hypothetical protein